MSEFLDSWFFLVNYVRSVNEEVCAVQGLDVSILRRRGWI